MFKFDFDLEDIDDDLTLPEEETTTSTKQKVDYPQEPFQQHPIAPLLELLPSLISYSPLSIPIASKDTPLTLIRRDLFDARFQLIAEGYDEPAQSEDTAEGSLAEASSYTSDVGSKNHVSTLGFLNEPSDLLPGVYEGGLKTWECSLDLVEYLSQIAIIFEGKRILELGCGTAIPSLYTLYRLFSHQHAADDRIQETQIHLQDYNSSVLELVTLPNVFLTWYLSLASASFREIQNLPPLDPSSPGELALSDELKEAFLASLKDNNIQIQFFSGSWDAFDLNRTGGKYDIILTSETIYRGDSLPTLIRLLDQGCNDSLETHASSEPNLSTRQSSAPPYLCLVAAKVLYFGVGGGISDFSETIETLQESNSHRRGKVEVVLEKTYGVGRKVLSIHWL